MNNQNITSDPLEDFELGMLTGLSSVTEETEIDDNADAAGLHNPNWIALFDSIKQSGKYLNRIKDLIVWCEFGNNI